MSSTDPVADPAPMRERIIAAALAVIEEKGIAAATTKLIARTAGVSEGSLYNHFTNRTALIGAAMAELVGGIRHAMIALLHNTGSGTVQDNLAAFADAAIAFYARLLPVTGPVYGDPAMLAQLSRDMPEQGLGPLRGHQGLIRYLTAEQDAGRLPADTSAPYLAAAILGACQQYAFLRMLVNPADIATHAALPTNPTDYAHQMITHLLPQS